jgi:hypothetical protein
LSLLSFVWVPRARIERVRTPPEYDRGWLKTVLRREGQRAQDQSMETAARIGRQDHEGRTRGRRAGGPSLTDPPPGSPLRTLRSASPGYDGPRGWRHWRALDLGSTRAYVEAEVVRVRCTEHGVVSERLPWAAHRSRFTRGFEEQVGWLAVESSKSAVAELMRVGWRTV